MTPPSQDRWSRRTGEAAPSEACADPAAPLVLKLLPPRMQDIRPEALEAAMRSLSLSGNEPVALELAAVAHEQMWLVRARSREALAHALRQIRARVPQATATTLYAADDPLYLHAGEAVSALELAPESSTFLPRQQFAPIARSEEGIDPLLGVLAALSDLPPGCRAIAQLALAPASPREVRSALGRQAPASPLLREREGRLGAPGLPTPLLLFGAAGILTVGALPGLRHALMNAARPILVPLFTGHLPTLSGEASLTSWGLLAALLVGGLLVACGLGLWRRHFPPRSLPDPRLLVQMRALPVAHARLRMYVIGPGLHARLAPLVWKLLTRPGWGTVGAIYQELIFRRGQAKNRHMVLTRVSAAYRQFDLLPGGALRGRRIPAFAARRLLGPAYGWSRGVARSPHLLSGEALASLWHLLQGPDLVHAPLVESHAARLLPIPPQLARSVQGTHLVGTAEQGSSRVPVAMAADWLRRHSLIVGKSGAGKSTLLSHLACAAMETGGGLVVIDPHGDLVTTLLAHVPHERRDEVVLIDLADQIGCVGLNPLDVTLGRSRDKAIADLLSTLSHIWMRSWGSRMENCFEFGLRTLWEVNRSLVTADPVNGPSRQYTLLDLLPLYTSESFCHRLLKEVADPYVKRWWRQYYEPLPLSMKREIINPVATKVAKFESELARRIVGQPCATINFAQVLSEQKILLVRLAQGTIGADAAPLLGATLVGLFSVCLQEQERLPPQMRVKLSILIDEFQVLEGVDWSLLAQIRKYGASFVLATQSLAYLHRLEAEVLPTVLSNVTQLFAFQMSAQDAWTLHRELGVTVEDLVQLDSHQCYVRLKHAEESLPTFSLRLIPLSPGDQGGAEAIRRRSRARYTRPPEEVEARLQEALARQDVTAPLTRPAKTPAQAAADDPTISAQAFPSPSIGSARHAPRVRGHGGKGRRAEPESLPLLFAPEEDAREAQEEVER
jgi:hypothetical protein